MSRRTLFHSLQFHDRAIEPLEAAGSTEAARFRDDPGSVVRAQHDWRDTGGVMLGSVTRAGDADDGWVRSAGQTDRDGRTCAVRDAEAVRWSSGSYGGE